jgi:hypothetical protein
MFDFPKKKDKSKVRELKLINKRHCWCGAMDYTKSDFPDLVNCNSCGAVYYLGAASPVATWTDEEEGE